MSQSKYICANCKNPVGFWFYGWKHQTGWKSPITCGRKPVPIPKPFKE